MYPPRSEYQAPTTAPPNYLVLAILVTLFCCLPAGIVAIVNAAQVNSKAAAGDYAGALRASNTARTWIIASAVVGVIVIVLYALVLVLARH